MDTLNNEVPSPADSRMNLTALLKYYLRHWWWFAISLLVFVGIAVLYLKIKNPVYESFGNIMFNQNEDEDPGGSMLGSLMASFTMGSTGSVNLEDEIFKLQSHSAIKEAVTQLDLNRVYTSKTSLFKAKTEYFGDSPYEIQIADAVLDTITATTKFVLKVSDKGKRMHLKVSQGIYKTVFNGNIPSLPYTVKTPLGAFTVAKTRFYKPDEDMKFTAMVYNSDTYATLLFKRVDVYNAVKKSNAVQVKVEDSNVKRARAIVATLIEIYNTESIAIRSAQSQATLDFLNGRLLKMNKELDNSESTIASYKESNRIVSPEAEAEYIFKLKQQADGSLIELETQLGILNMLKDFLSSEANKNSLIPLSGITANSNNGDAVNNAINSYNEMVLELLKLQSSAKGPNATLKHLENQISAMRINLRSTLDRAISATKISISRMSSENGSINSRITSMPRMEQQLTNLYRDNEIKNRIYAYLLQKREEAEVKLARTLPTGMIIDEAYTDIEPISPKKGLTLVAMILCGVLLPGVILFYACQKSVVTRNRKAEREEEDDIKELLD